MFRLLISTISLLVITPAVCLSYCLFSEGDCRVYFTVHTLPSNLGGRVVSSEMMNKDGANPTVFFSSIYNINKKSFFCVK